FLSKGINRIFECPLGYERPWSLHQRFKYGPLTRRENDRLFAQIGAFGFYIDLHFSKAKYARPMGVVAPENRIDPCTKFLEIKRFDQIVISSPIESADPVPHLVSGSENDAHATRDVISNAVQKLQTRSIGEPQIEQNETI